jgi:hypothetical protein
MIELLQNQSFERQNTQLVAAKKLRKSVNSNVVIISSVSAAPETTQGLSNRSRNYKVKLTTKPIIRQNAVG